MKKIFMMFMMFMIITVPMVFERANIVTELPKAPEHGVAYVIYGTDAIWTWDGNFEEWVLVKEGLTEI